MNAVEWIWIGTVFAAWWVVVLWDDARRENIARREELRKLKCRCAGERLERFGVDRLTDAQLDRLLREIFVKPSPATYSTIDELTR